MDITYRLQLFREMISCCHNLYVWNYDANLQLLDSNCPEQTLLNGLLSVGEHQKVLLSFAEEHHKPIILTNTMGIMWVGAPEREHDELKRIHVLGPFFIDNSSTQQIEQRLNQLHLSANLHRQAIRFLQELPVISLNRIFEYAIMLHYCITEEKIGVSDLHYRKTEQPQRNVSAEESAKLHGTYAAEQEMLRYVREGDLNYLHHMNKMSMIGNMGKLSNNDSNRQMKNLVLVCITLFSRAAIEGGLAPEISLSLTDYYFQSVEACTSIAELSEISHTMQEDFIKRVHRCRYDTTMTRPIRTCIEYINLHLEEEVTLEALADMAGYSTYYLSKRFKREVGQTPKEYIRNQRLERAKFLLHTTTNSIQDISETLCFSSKSYFADAFHKSIGITPSEYREQAQSGMRHDK